MRGPEGAPVQQCTGATRQVPGHFVARQDHRVDPDAAILGIPKMREQLLRTPPDPGAPQPDWVRRRMLRRSAEGATRVTLDEIKALGLRLAELCQKYGIAELSVFGSVARGDARPDSDVDLLYVRVPGNDLGMSYFALQDDLEKLFGRPVDLVPKESLHRVIRDQILADAQVLYAA
jgi:predicted nucleotidyltransferase